MKNRIYLIFLSLFLGINAIAQNSDECAQNLSIFAENAKIKNYKSLVIACIISFLLLALNSFLGMYILLSMCLVLLIIMYVSWKSIKGQTGDICGASQQLTETLGWFTVVYLY